MEINSINSKWTDLEEYKENEGYRSLRISAECIPDLFLAIDESGNRCLILFLPESTKIDFKGSVKKKLAITYIRHKSLVLLKLSDQDFFDLFNDLILSLYSKIKNIVDPILYSKELFHSFYRWVEFFEDRRETKLSSDDIKGLFGELTVLNNLLTNASPMEFNNILKSWKGPYDESKDFSLEEKSIEVKTREESSVKISISSKFQLEKENGKSLELIIVTVKKDYAKGNSIYDLIARIAQLIRAKGGDLSIFYHSIGQKGLTIESSKDYDNYRFIPIRATKYDCENEKFPSLIASNIPEEILARVSGL